VTWWRNNYGSILQAYALQKELETIDEIEYEILNQYSNKIASVENLLSKLKTFGLKQTARRIVFRFGLKKLRSRVNVLQKFISVNLRVSKKIYDEKTIANANNEYDGFICGSDQIWNPVLSPVNSIYWLNFVETEKARIAYAPSFGVNEIPVTESRIISDNLSKFNAISCREKSGTQLLNQILEKEICCTVVDPTLLVDRDVWDSICPERKYKFPYIFAYMLRGNKEQRRFIERIAQEKGLLIVTIPFLDPEKIVWYDFKFGNYKEWDASPVDFISLIRNAEYVFTDSYHCMVFSCLYHTQYYAFPKLGKAQLNRMKDLQTLLGISDRIIMNMNTFKLPIADEICWSDVDRNLAVKRMLSKKYLQNSIYSVMTKRGTDGR